MAEAPSRPTISEEVNLATRNHHTTLNLLITSRLPLCLPPYTIDGALYTTGMHHFSYVFQTFESLWADLEASQSSSPASPTASTTSPLLSYLLVNPYDNPARFTPTKPPSPELLQFLANLRPRGMARSARLKRDLEFLLKLSPTDLDVKLSTYPSDDVAAFCTHIREAVAQRPHVLIAYAWCFYMAVFAGGRWIRSQLVNAAEQFWDVPASEEGTGDENTALSTSALSFWNFAGDQDGEDIKATFKERLAAAEPLFTDEIRADVVEEAKNIFDSIEKVVQGLDRAIGTDLEMLDRGKRIKKKRELEKEKVDEGKEVLAVGVKEKGGLSVKAFVRRPEVTGGLVALGCLTWVLFLRLDS